MPTLPFRNSVVGRPVLSDAQRAATRMTDIIRKQMSVDAVFEGGGALGAAYLGALRALHDNGIWFNRVAGNSAGSITAAMIAVGFTAPEIQWLSSCFPIPQAQKPATLTALGINAPIQFADFLDLPNINSISRENKRKTLLWKILKGSIIDEIGKQPIPIPTQSTAVASCVQAIMGVPVLGDAIRAIPGTSPEALLRNAINTALDPLPNNQLHISDILPDTENLRTTLADTLWDAIMRNNPLYLMMTNLVHEGGIFEGTVFLNTIKSLFSKKIPTPDGIVRFKDLKIPLVVIAANIDTGKMVVYSSKTHPNQDVAEAVRQSMSIPFVFEPRGNKKQIVDGGLFSNFPVWVYSAAGNNYWDAADIDNNRIKIGFSVDDTQPAPSTWNVQPPRFTLTGNPPHVDPVEVFSPILVEKLVAFGIPRNLAESEVTSALLGEVIPGGNSRPGIELFQEILGVSSGIKNAEDVTRKIMLAGLMNGLPYINIPVPLLGYDVFDFYVNEDESALIAMWDRAWQKTIEELKNAANQGILPPVMNLKIMKVEKTQTPFNPR